MSQCVLRPWVCDLSMMQQSVLITGVRGPDGIAKDHTAKLLLRWMRRCILYSAMDKRELLTPHEDGGGSFTGPVVAYGDLTLDSGYWQHAMDDVVTDYLRCVDELAAPLSTALYARRRDSRLQIPGRGDSYMVAPDVSKNRKRRAPKPGKRSKDGLPARRQPRAVVSERRSHCCESHAGVSCGAADAMNEIHPGFFE